MSPSSNFVNVMHELVKIQDYPGWSGKKAGCFATKPPRHMPGCVIGDARARNPIIASKGVARVRSAYFLQLRSSEARPMARRRDGDAEKWKSARARGNLRLSSRGRLFCDLLFSERLSAALWGPARCRLDPSFARRRGIKKQPLQACRVKSATVMDSVVFFTRRASSNRTS